MDRFWLLFMALVIFSVFRSLLGRAGSRGRSGGPWGDPSSGRDLPWRRTPGGEGREYRPKLNLPEYLTRRSGDQTDGDVAAKERERPLPAIEDGAAVIEKNNRGKKPEKPLHEGHLEDTAVLSQCSREDQKETAPRECNRGRGGADMFDAMICPGEVIRGVFWSEILGPRGGLRSKRR